MLRMVDEPRQKHICQELRFLRKNDYETTLSRECAQSDLSHITRLLICTAAVYDDVFFAYLVAMPRQCFIFRNAFSS